VGWDGHASPTPPRDVKYKFREAAENVKSQTGNVDALLMHGLGLDCTACARWLERLTGRNAWENWSAQQMKQNYGIAMSKELFVPANEMWAYLSALEFMRVCSENGLGMAVSY
jgi:hypothetical protein